MLHALGFPNEQMPRFLVHGWWNISGAKMSKSLGNVIDPNELADKYGPEALRYYLISDMVIGKDADFSNERLITRYNTELANSLGNLLNRSLSMTGKYATGKIRSVCEVGSVADTLKNSVLGKTEKARTLTFSQTLSEAAFESVVLANVAIETAAPWQMAKDDAKRGQLDSLLYTLAESLRIIAILISPVLPKAAHGIFDQLSWKMEPELAGKEERFSLAEADWGRLPDGHMVGKPTPLFPRIEV